MTNQKKPAYRFDGRPHSTDLVESVWGGKKQQCSLTLPIRLALQIPETDTATFGKVLLEHFNGS